MSTRPLTNEHVRQFGWMFGGKHPNLIGMNIIREGACGMPEVNIHHNGVTYAVRFDFAYLDKDSEVYGQVPVCLQVIFDNPAAMDGDPAQHVRIFPDGKVETFDC